MLILITGACGFIGSHLTDAMLREGHAVIGLDDLSTGRRENFPSHPDAHFIEWDIRNPLPSLGSKYDLVYHCAASYRDRADWERDAAVNVSGTINVVRTALASQARLVYFQTSLCYGPKPVSPIQPDAPLAPVGSYAVSKTAGENYIRDSGLEWVSLRLANIYGPRNLSGPVPTFYKRIVEDQECTVVDSRRDFIFIDDLIRVATKAATQGRGIYHVSTGSDAPISEVYGAVASALGQPDRTYLRKAREDDDVETLLLDPSDTYHEFGWAARVPLINGIYQAVEWYKTHGVTDTYTHLALKG